MSSEVRRIARNYMREAKEVSLASDAKAPAPSTTSTVVMARDHRPQALWTPTPDRVRHRVLPYQTGHAGPAENLTRDGYNADAMPAT
ncbi:MAG: hypothetical protein IPL86_03330 [Flavobacteriales bacterium]|nr:hypothetical protein [Flavobacteriales bacterium]